METITPLKILFATTSFPRYPNDYAGSFVYRTAKYLARDGMQIDVVAPSDKDVSSHEIFDSMNIYRFVYFISDMQCVAYGKGGILANLRISWLAKIQLPFFMISMLWALLSRIRNYDVIHCHWLPVAFIAVLARMMSFSNTPIILTNWGSDTRLTPLWIQKFILKYVQGCISTAVETDEHLLRAGYENFINIPAPVDEERFSNISNTDKTREELGIKGYDYIVSFIGRLNYFKDPLTFINACDELNKRNLNFRALIAGDGDLYDNCRNRITECGLNDKVILLGLRDDIEKLLAISTVTVHISPVENTWANVIAEAMFVGVPVIISDAGYTKKTFTDGVDCIIIPALDAKKLADEIESLFLNRDKRESLTNGARELMKKHGKYSQEITGNIIAYYRNILIKK